jgi:hypothetical protein
MSTLCWATWRPRWRRRRAASRSRSETITCRAHAAGIQAVDAIDLRFQG